jgi:hypothetical protein
VKKAKKSEKKRQKRKNRLEFRFTLFRFEAKITKSKRSEKFIAKKSGKKQKKAGKKRKKVKKSEKKPKNRLEFRFALFHFEAKITKEKRSETFEAKRCKKKRKREVKFYSEIVKHK